MRLAARALTRSYAGRVALEPTELTLRGGECLVLVGPNGAGKSTLIALCAGLRLPHGGTATLDGRPARDPDARRVLGVVVDRAVLPPARSLRSLLAERSPSDPEALLGELGVSSCADRPVGTLSAGQRQRGVVALALHGDPGVILLDEPLSGLDPDGVDRVVRAVDTRRRAGAAVLVATHRPEAWIPVGTHLARMDGGRLSAPRPMGEALGELPRTAMGLVGGALAPVDPGPVVHVRWGWGPTSPVETGISRGSLPGGAVARGLAALRDAGRGVPTALAVAGGMLALGMPLTRAAAMGDPTRATLDVALWAAWMASCLLAVGIGSRAIAAPLADRTATHALAGPLSPGRWGLERLAASAAVAVAAHGALLAWGLTLHGAVPAGLSAHLTLVGAELALLVALSGLAGTILPPVGAMAVVGALWLVGHLGGVWLDVLAVDGLDGAGSVLLALLPDLDLLDVHGAVLDGRPPAAGDVALALLWAVAWTGAAGAGTVMVLNRRDLV